MVTKQAIIQELTPASLTATCRSISIPVVIQRRQDILKFNTWRSHLTYSCLERYWESVEVVCCMVEGWMVVVMTMGGTQHVQQVSKVAHTLPEQRPRLSSRGHPVITFLLVSYNTNITTNHYYNFPPCTWRLGVQFTPGSPVKWWE